jgi:hypothetical protein
MLKLITIIAIECINHNAVNMFGSLNNVVNMLNSQHSVQFVTQCFKELKDKHGNRMHTVNTTIIYMNHDCVD